jgi:phosphoesterase RecJ-like protein
MKILQVITSMRMGGAEKLVAEMVPLMKKAGHEVIFFAMQDPEKNFPCEQEDYFVSNASVNGGIQSKLIMILHLTYSKEAYQKMQQLLQDEKPDLVISVDIASRKLFGELERELCEEVDIKIDHHESGDDFAPRAYVDPRASATGEIVWKLIPHLGEVADRAKMKAAQRALYGAISADTGGFRYSNVTAETHRIAAEMIEAGVACAEISHGLFESRGEDEIRATQAGYEALSFHAGGKIAMMVITCEAMVRWNLDEDVLGVISALPREIRGVELGIVLRQSKKYPDTFKISMRSGESVDVSRLCGVFGGGGHLRAAGGEIHAQSPEEAAKAVLVEAIKQFEQN